MQTWIVILDEGRTELVEAQSILETDDALEFYNGAKLMARFVHWDGWKLLGHVS